jgi:hypothetical protein
VAILCAKCGAPNPDGNQFCQACGMPLAAAAAAPAAASWSPVQQSAAAATSAGYQSPYIAPSTMAPQPSVHRTPWVLIISAVLVLVVLLAGVGIAISILGNRSGANQGSSSDILPSPASTPAPIPKGSVAVSNKGVTIVIPAGWKVSSKDDQNITVTNPSGDGSVSIGSGASNPHQTADQNKETLDKYFHGRYPNTKACSGSKTTTGTINGASGISWQLCFTLSQGGQSIQAESPLFAGANSSGSVYYVVLLYTSQSNAKAFTAQAGPILQSIQWKLR